MPSSQLQLDWKHQSVSTHSEELHITVTSAAVNHFFNLSFPFVELLEMYKNYMSLGDDSKHLPMSSSKTTSCLCTDIPSKLKVGGGKIMFLFKIPIDMLT